MILAWFMFPSSIAFKKIDSAEYFFFFMMYVHIHYVLIVSIQSDIHYCHGILACFYVIFTSWIDWFPAISHRRGPNSFQHRIFHRMDPIHAIITQSSVREITKRSSTFSATNISSNIWFIQLHDTIKMKSNHTGINHNHNNIDIRSHIMIYNSV